MVDEGKTKAVAAFSAATAALIDTILAELPDASEIRRRRRHGEASYHVEWSEATGRPVVSVETAHMQRQWLGYCTVTLPDLLGVVKL